MRYHRDAHRVWNHTPEAVGGDQHGAEPAVTDDRVPHVLRRVRRYEVEEIGKWLATGEIDENRLGP